MLLLCSFIFGFFSSSGERRKQQQQKKKHLLLNIKSQGKPQNILS